MNKQIAKDKFLAMKQMMEKYDLQTTAITSYIESIDDFKVTSPLVGRFSTGKSSLLNGLLGKKVEIAKKTINDSLDLITKEYSEAMNKTYSKEETKESIETLYQSEKTLYSNLLGMLDTFDKISSSEMKAVQEVNTFRTELAKIIAKDDGVAPTKKVNVKASNLIPVANRKITSKDDIDHLVENIKTHLESLLKDNEEVDID